MRQHAYVTGPKGCGLCKKPKTDSIHEKAFAQAYNDAKLAYMDALRELNIADGMRVPPDKLKFLQDRVQRLLALRKAAFEDFMECEEKL